ncbi:MAG TPA: serine hydrolase domain-containing protein [Phenylobacterium sp.]
MAEAAETFGMSSERLARIRPAMETLIGDGKFYGGVILVARHGQVLLHEAVGYRDWGAKTPMTKDAVFSIFSMTKSLTGVLALNAIENGRFALTTKVCEIIPEFSGGVREDITFYHLLTHTSGLPMTFTPVPGMYIDRLDEVIEAICKKVHSEATPGDLASYAPMVAHALMGEAVRRTDPQGRSFRQIMEDVVLKPLGMPDTSVGLRRDLKARHIKPVWLFDKGALQHLGRSNHGTDGAFEEEDAEMPWVGVASTVSDIFRFTEMLRRGGELDGARILSPVTLERTRINETGDKTNQLYGRNAIARGWEPMPAYLSIGFSLRGEAICHHQFGTLTSPQTFGQHGQGSMLYWVDPKHDVTFVCLSHGVMIEGENVERFQKLSDLAITSVI